MFPPAVSTTEIFPGQGWTSVVLIDFTGMNTLPPGTGYELYNATYLPSTNTDWRKLLGTCWLTRIMALFFDPSLPI